MTAGTTIPDIYVEAIDALGEKLDDLGDLVDFLAKQLGSVGLRKIICTMRGVSNISPSVKSINHGTAVLLDHM